jgi:hypothetical protein
MSEKLIIDEAINHCQCIGIVLKGLDMDREVGEYISTKGEKSVKERSKELGTL